MQSHALRALRSLRPSPRALQTQATTNPFSTLGANLSKDSSSPSTPQDKSAIKPSHKVSKSPSGDYGSGTGHPAAENPTEQGTSTVASDLEHPGPAPPKAGRGSGSATKADSRGHVADQGK